VARFTEHLRSLLVKNQTPFGEIYPPKANPPPLAIDGRTAALRVLREYLTNQIFYREMGRGQPPQAFQIPPNRIHIEQPDSVQDQTAPSLAFVSGPRADYNVIGLTTVVEDETADVYQQGTVLQWQGEYEEHFKLEIHAAYKSERRGILSAIETCMTPTEQMYGIRFKMPEYYDELVCFTLWGRGELQEATSHLNRRVAWLEVEMRFHVVALVNVKPIYPTVQVNTDVIQPYGTDIGIELEVDPPANRIPIDG
jgi:hypothetical protein